MTANGIKIIACLSMLLDHIGYLLLPEVQWLRWCGRLALPLFAYLVAEGCRHTRNRKRYFLRMLGLGVLCQLVYVAEELLGGGISSVYLNILLTLSAAQLLCFAWLDFMQAVEQGKGQRTAAARFLLLVAAATAVTVLGEAAEPLTGIAVTFDYGLAGMLLPVFGLLASTKWTRLLAFGGGVVLLCLSTCEVMPFSWMALLALPVLALYSGKRGTSRLQYVFYAFYPLHLVALYGIQFLL